MSFVTTALGLMEFIPIFARSLRQLREGAGDKEEVQETAQNLISIAQKITGASSLPEAIHLLGQNSLLVAEFQKEVLRWEAELETILLKDRLDARARSHALEAAGKNNKRADIMVCAAAMGLILCLGTLSFLAHQLPGEVTGIISTIAGIFGACLKDAYTFEFGSSRGSKEKDFAVQELLKKSL